MSAIFYHDPEQRQSAEESLQSVRAAARGSVRTQILAASKFYNAESYHQKWMLQKHAVIMKQLDLDDDEHLICSHEACRLNGYLGGYGNMNQFNKECSRLNINEDMIDYVRQVIRNKTAS